MIILFIYINILITTSVIFTIKSIKIIHSIFWLVLSYLFSSILLFLLNFNLLAIILIFIYSGAIAILFIFAIFIFNLNYNEKININFNYEKFFYLIGVFLLIILSIKFNYLIIDLNLNKINNLIIYKNEFFQLGNLLINKLGWIIIICAIILLIPMLIVLFII